MPVFGPGVLKIGATATAVDVSCLINGARITTEADVGDPTYKLCGTMRPGTRKYSSTLTGNMDIDPEDPDGIFMLSQTDYGTEVPFVFTPNNTIQVTATGTVVIDPLDFGADEFGDDMTSDFEWSIVGNVTYSPTVPTGDGLDDLDAAAADHAQPELVAADV